MKKKIVISQVWDLKEFYKAKRSFKKEAQSMESAYASPSYKFDNKFESTKNVVSGEIVGFFRPVFENSGRYGKTILAGYKYQIVLIEKESYGAKGQHTFSYYDFENKNRTHIKGRNLYENCYSLKEPKNIQNLREEKQARGSAAKFAALQNWLFKNDENHPFYYDKKERFDRLSK